MDIASLSTVLSLSQVNADVGVAVLGKQLDMAEIQGSSLVKALEQSVTPHLGNNIDVTI